MDSENGSDHYLISTEMLENILDESLSHLSIIQWEACYKLHDRIRQRQSEWTKALKDMQNMGKSLHKVFKTAVKGISQDLIP